MPNYFTTIRSDVPAPVRATRGAAGWDLRAAVDARVEPQDWTLVPTGYGVRVPAGYVGLVCPRSGLAVHHGLTVLNSPGVIDPDYEGELQVILANHSAYPVDIGEGDRIAQLLIVPSLDAGAPATGVRRGIAGFGSTGR